MLDISCPLKIPAKISVLCNEADVCSSICCAWENVTNIFLKKKKVVCFAATHAVRCVGSLACLSPCASYSHLGASNQYCWFDGWANSNGCSQRVEEEFSPRPRHIGLTTAGSSLVQTNDS